MKKEHHRIGFASTRLAGTDGVSLETAKWARLLEDLGHACFFFAGESEWPAERSYVVPEAHFQHPEVRAIQRDLFDNYERSRETSIKVQELKEDLKEDLYQFVDEFDLELLIAENALSIPMHVPLGLALTELIAETNWPLVGHHHDFAWERNRFKVTAASDYQMGAFPPILPTVYHVVINSYAARQLALRTGISSLLIPNVMDFHSPPAEPDAYADDLRAALGVSSDAYLLLQPTRVVPRKQIEHAIELASRLKEKGLACVLLISHSTGDEGTEYETYLRGLAELLGVQVLFASEIIDDERGTTPDGRKIYSLSDVYQKADLVTYPSRVEGFGNAFLEALFFRRPIVMGTYEIYLRDIKPKGFQVVEIRDFITEETVTETYELLRDPEQAAAAADANYDLARRYYSYPVLESHLVVLLQSLGL
jgi:glycosyltransferase involved in cell wall biosynthesis